MDKKDKIFLAALAYEIKGDKSMSRDEFIDSVLNSVKEYQETHKSDKAKIKSFK